MQDGVELWYHQLGRVDPPLPKPSAAGAADYLAKERYYGHSNLQPDSGSVSGRGGSSSGRGSWQRQRQLAGAAGADARYTAAAWPPEACK